MSDVTLEKCCQFIGLYEPSTEARVNNQLLLDGTVPVFFTRFNYFRRVELEVYSWAHMQ